MVCVDKFEWTCVLSYVNPSDLKRSIFILAGTLLTRVQRNMKAARQVEAVELMIASNTVTVAHAEALLKATPREQPTDLPALNRGRKTPPIEQLVNLEKKMSQVQEHYKDAELNY